MGIPFCFQRNFLLILKKIWHNKWWRILLVKSNFWGGNRRVEAAKIWESWSPHQRKIWKRPRPPTAHLLQILNPSNKWCGLILCSTSFAVALRKSPTPHERIVRRAVWRSWENVCLSSCWKTGQTINQMILQGKEVCIKELRVPTVQFWTFST